MIFKLLLNCLLGALLISSIDCQQVVQLLRSASNQNPSISQPSAQASNSQPQLLSLEQQQQLLQQLAALQRQQQPQQPQNQFFNQPSQSQSQPQFQPQEFIIQPPQGPPQQPSQPQGGPAGGQPAINWGKCPQLEPSDKEKMTKASVITKCLESTPLPTNITRDSVETHREQIAACALQSEGWFTPGGGYDFKKAESEIRNKRLTKTIEDQVVNYHKQCKEEAEQKYPTSKSTIIAQIQLYQACMDYFISDVCGIEVNEPESPQFA